MYLTRGLIFKILDRKENKSLSDAQIQKLLAKYRIIMLLIERFAIYVLSAAYIIFNCIYWTWLLTESNHVDWFVNSTYNNIDG